MFSANATGGSAVDVPWEQERQWYGGDRVNESNIAQREGGSAGVLVVGWYR
jgi:hypothetical protein